MHNVIMVRTLGAICAVLAPFIFPALADEEPVSSVRQAAIKKMEQKLGTMRGTIEIDQRYIYLTPKMIEQLKPITAHSHVAAKRLNEESEQIAAAEQAARTSITKPDLVQSHIPATIEISPDELELQKEAIMFSDKVLISADTADRSQFTEIEQVEGFPLRMEQLDTKEVRSLPKRVVASEEKPLSRSEVLRREIFSQSRKEAAANENKKRLVTNSVIKSPKPQGILPETDDIDLLMDAVDKMIENKS